MSDKDIEKLKLPELFYRLSSIKIAQCILVDKGIYNLVEVSKTYRFKFRGLKTWHFICEFGSNGDYISGWVRKGTRHYDYYTRHYDYYSNFKDLDVVLDEKKIPEETKNAILFNMNDLRRKKFFYKLL